MHQTKIQQNSGSSFFYGTMAVAAALALISKAIPSGSVSDSFKIVSFFAIISGVFGHMLINDARRYGWPSVLKGLVVIVGLFGMLFLYIWLKVTFWQ